ncbi:MAG: ribonuclease D [Rhodospirillales bacterium]
MLMITKTDDLARLCTELADEPWITIDTEFIRDRTYWPRLCLVQVAGAKTAACIDPMADGIDLGPLYRLLADESVIKVFHAARQDVEIFLKEGGAIPKPMFDTQIAAMVCGYGDQVGYEALVKKIARKSVDKSSRFTDWARRPLTDKQLDYAVSDVTHLRVIYEELSAHLDKTGRRGWIDDEMAVLTNPSTYTVEPMEAWQRIKSRNPKPRFLALLRELAAWRELEAQRRDVPRNRIMKDDGLLEIAAQRPKDVKELSNCRSVPQGFASSRAGTDILEAVQRGVDLPQDQCPQAPERQEMPPEAGPVAEILKVLLKLRAQETGVAQRLIASTPDIELLAADDNADIAAMKGWRREVFGAEALEMKHGKLAITIRDSALAVVKAGS